MHNSGGYFQTYSCLNGKSIQNSMTVRSVVPGCCGSRKCLSSYHTCLLFKTLWAGFYECCFSKSYNSLEWSKLQLLTMQTFCLVQDKYTLPVSAVVTLDNVLSHSAIRSVLYFRLFAHVFYVRIWVQWCIEVRLFRAFYMFFSYSFHILYYILLILIRVKIKKQPMGAGQTLSLNSPLVRPVLFGVLKS